jgi:two-component system chemotaxis response regulator CheB
LPELLTSAGSLPARHPEDGEPIRPGIIYIAPPDRHMTVESGRIRLSRGPRHHFTRPAIDPLFRSAAEVFGPRVIGVVLSGTGTDGTAGLETIQRAGGTTVIQQPRDALYPEMPQSAAAALQIDRVSTRADLPALLQRLSAETVAMKAPPVTTTNMDEFERPAALTCPECGGALREITGTAAKQYRCHTGHSFGAEEVLDGQIEEVDHALGVALRVLNERVELCRHMAEYARSGGRSLGIAHWDRLKTEAEEQLHVLQQFLARPPTRAVPGKAEGRPELRQA